MSKWVKCDNCQKKEIKSGSEGVYLRYCRGVDSGRGIHVCYDCYQYREQEYLQNYEFIYSYDPEHYRKKKTSYVKTGSSDCHAEQKDGSGRVLKQKDCPHCCPWKIWKLPANQYECANCNKIIEKGEITYWGNDSKLLCCQECVDVHNKNNIPSKNNNSQQNSPPKPKNINKGMSSEVKILLGTGITFLALAIGIVGVKLYKRSRKKTS